MASNNIIKPNSIIKVINKKIKVLYDVYNTSSNRFDFSRIVSFGNHKFLIDYHVKNGVPCGYKYDQAIKIFKNGTWENLADCEMIGICYNNNYYDNNNGEKCVEFVKLAYNYIEILYSDIA